MEIYRYIISVLDAHPLGASLICPPKMQSTLTSPASDGSPSISSRITVRAGDVDQDWYEIWTKADLLLCRFRC